MPRRLESGSWHPIDVDHTDEGETKANISKAQWNMCLSLTTCTPAQTINHAYNVCGITYRSEGEVRQGITATLPSLRVVRP